MNRFSILFVLVSFLISPFSFAVPTAMSPSRPTNKTYTEMARKFSLFKGGGDHFSSAYMDRRSFAKTSWQAVPQVSEAELRNLFEHVRDYRPLTDREKRARRLTWLFPDDGCYARAEMMVGESEKAGHELPMKIFAFGDLWVKSDFAVGGQVSWWYHVAPILRVGQQVYVLDPSIDSSAPLKVEEWLRRMNAKVEISVCAAHTYSPESPCQGRVPDQRSRAHSDVTYFLDAEWSRVLDLERIPEDDLGDRPPWQKNILF